MKRSSAQAHAKHAHHCTCGEVVHGNGGKFHHGQRHKRQADGHHYITQTAWIEMQARALREAIERQNRETP